MGTQSPWEDLCGVCDSVLVSVNAVVLGVVGLPVGAVLPIPSVGTSS